MAEHCRWCGNELPPGDVSYCDLHTEVVELRKLRDRLAEWADQAEAFDRDGGSIEAGFKVGTDLDSVVASARALKGASPRRTNER